MITKKTEGVLPVPDSMVGKIMIVREDLLSTQFQAPQYQLVEAQSGFGCYAGLRGRAVFGESLADHENCRWERSDFLGEASPELVKTYFPDYYNKVKA